MAFKETFFIVDGATIIDPSVYEQGDIVTKYAGTATVVTNTHTVDDYKVMIEYADDFAENIDIYVDGELKIEDRAVIGKNGFLTYLIGTTADPLDFPNSLVKLSTYDSGDTSVDNIGFVAEAGGFQSVGTGDIMAVGVKGIGISITDSVPYTNHGVGLYGKGIRDNGTSPTGFCVGVWANTTDTGASAINTAFYADSANAGTNYSFYGNAGTIYNLGTITTGALTSNTVTINGSTIAGQVVSRVNTGLATTAELGLGRAENTTAGRGATIYGTRSRGTLAARTAVSADDTLLSIVACGHDGTDLATSAQINFQVDTTPGSNDMPGRIVFSVSPDGSQTPAEAFRISNDKTAVFQANLAADTFRLASGKFIGYSAATGTAPTGGISFDTSNNASCSGSITSVSLVRCNNTAATPIIRGRRVNAGSTAVGSGNVITQFDIQAYNGSAYVSSAYMQGIATETHSGSTSATKLEFYSTAKSATSAALRATISEAGVCADTFRLPSGGYIGYSADVTTAPTGGLTVDTANNVTASASLTVTQTLIAKNGIQLDAGEYLGYGTTGAAPTGGLSVDTANNITASASLTVTGNIIQMAADRIGITNGVGIVWAGTKTLTEAVTVSLFDATVANNTAIAIDLEYYIFAYEAPSTVETHSGLYHILAKANGTTITSTSTHDVETDLPVGTGITDTFVLTNGSGKITVGLKATSGLAPDTLQISYIIKNLSGQAITLL